MKSWIKKSLEGIKNNIISIIIILLIFIIICLFGKNIESLLKPYPRLTTIFSMVLTITIAYLGFNKENKENDERSNLIKSSIDLKIYKKCGSDYENKNLEQLNNHLKKIKKLKMKKGHNLVNKKRSNEDSILLIFTETFTNEIAIFARYYIDYRMENFFYNLVEELENELIEVRNLGLSQNYRNDYKVIIKSIDEIIKVFDERKRVLQGDHSKMRERMKNQDNIDIFTQMFLNNVFKEIEDISENFNNIYEYHETIRKIALR